MENKQLRLCFDKDLTSKYSFLNLPNYVGQEKWGVVHEVEKEYKKKGFRVASLKELEIILENREEDFVEGLNYIYWGSNFFASPISLCSWSNPALAEYRHGERVYEFNYGDGSLAYRVKKQNEFEIYRTFPFVAVTHYPEGDSVIKQFPKHYWRKKDRLVIVRKGNLL